MNRKELLKLAEESRKLKELYFRPGLDSDLTQCLECSCIQSKTIHDTRKGKKNSKSTQDMKPDIDG